MQHFDLGHRTPECAGRWVDGLRLWGRQWRCSLCGATHPDSPRVLSAVANEYAHEHLLHRLATEGAALLRGGGR